MTLFWEKNENLKTIKEEPTKLPNNLLTIPQDLQSNSVASELTVGGKSV